MEMFCQVMTRVHGNCLYVQLNDYLIKAGVDMDGQFGYHLLYPNCIQVNPGANLRSEGSPPMFRESQAFFLYIF